MAMIKIDIDDVKSSNIAGITFTAEQGNDSFSAHTSIVGVLLVEYVNGAIYRCSNVPFAAVLNFLGVHSYGAGIRHIMNNYKYEKVVKIDDTF